MKQDDAYKQLNELIEEFKFKADADLVDLKNLINHQLFSLSRRFQNKYWENEISFDKFFKIKNKLLESKKELLEILVQKDFVDKGN